MSRKLRLIVWLAAVLASGLAAYILTAGGAKLAAVRPYAPTLTEPANALAQGDDSNEIETVADTAPAGDAPWASAEAIAFNAMLRLVYEHRISEARLSAKRFYDDFPQSPYAPRVQRLTGIVPVVASR